MSVGCAVAVRCGCCCGSVVVAGARGGAGVVFRSSLLPWVVLRVVATAGETTATQSVADLEVEDVDASATAVVAMVAETCLVEAVEAGNVEDPVAKAQACST